MIEVAHISPISNLYLMEGQKYNMFLTHLALKYPFYLEYAKKLSKTSYTILDNSLIENNGRALSLDSVLKVAEYMKPREIILPDVLLDSDATYKAVKESIEQLHQIYGHDIPYNLMAVAQGKTLDEVTDIIRKYENIGEITTIGIPKVLTKYSPKGRPGFESAWKSSSKAIHLLGLYYSFTELAEYKRPQRIRSVDTCQLSYLAKYHLNIKGTRPEGYTLDLENDIILLKEYTNVTQTCTDNMSPFSLGKQKCKEHV